MRRRRIEVVVQGRFLPVSNEKKLWEIFHRLWGKAADNPNYNKQDWKDLQLLIERALPTKEPPRN